MRVLHISPTYFSEQSCIGGGERYAYELAKAMAQKEQVVFLSFATERASHRDGALRVEHIKRHVCFRRSPLAGNPISLAFIKWVRWADVIHCHQVHTVITALAITFGKLFGRKVFVTDLGSGHRYAPSYYLPLLKWTQGFLLISEYSRQLWEKASSRSRPASLHVIYGGVDTRKFAPGNGERSKTALFVGRLLPHKGIDYLIEAIRGGIALDIVGRVYHQEYFTLLKVKSQNQAVRFYTNLDDELLSRKYQHALVTVLPSVYENCYGDHTLVPELLGLAALESMACGTPVILTQVASLPEIIQDGITGFLVPPNDPGAIRQKIEFLRANPTVAEEMGKRGRKTVLERFNWDTVADRCLASYCS